MSPAISDVSSKKSFGTENPMAKSEIQPSIMAKLQAAQRHLRPSADKMGTNNMRTL
jgi:hypothetical protein